MNAANTIKKFIPDDDELIVFISGLAGSGKTTICDDISMNLGGAKIHFDWYLSQRTLDRKNGIRKALDSGDAAEIEAKENPLNWYDWDKFSLDLQTLRRTRKLVIDDAWDQRTGEKNLTVNLELTESNKVWCEGMYMLHPTVVELADLNVLVLTSPELARQRTDERDGHRSTKQYLAYKDSLVRRYDLPYFVKYAHAADVIIDNTHFESAKLIYPT